MFTSYYIHILHISFTDAFIKWSTRTSYLNYSLARVAQQNDIYVIFIYAKAFFII